MTGWARRLRDALRTLVPTSTRTGARGASTSDRHAAGAPGGHVPPTPPAHRTLPDHTGRVRAEYSPVADGRPDPGEIVWTWVAYEDDPSRGKDRPVLLVGREGPVLLALPLTSKDHDRDAADAAREARYGRVWTDIGSGPWDPRRRPSEVRLDRVLRIDPAAVRREGAVLPEAVFRRVTDSLAELHGW